MRNFLKYSFSVLMIIACLILFTILTFKVLILDKKPKEEQISEPPVTEEIPDKQEDDAPQKDASESRELDPEAVPFTKVDDSYFNDALFIGDSRTLGIKEYGQIPQADFFTSTGMSVYNVNDKVINVDGIGDVTLEKLLSSKQYGKIYLMLGINEIGYNRESTIKKYGGLVSYIHDKEPDSVIFLQANLHVAAGRSDNDDVVNNTNIDNFNKSIIQFIDNRRIFYIDVNVIFDDEKGNLKAECTSDNTHVYAKYYADWVDWLKTKAILV